MARTYEIQLSSSLREEKLYWNGHQFVEASLKQHAYTDESQAREAFIIANDFTAQYAPYWGKGDYKVSLFEQRGNWGGSPIASKVHIAEYTADLVSD